jgi:hypothetical protein
MKNRIKSKAVRERKKKKIRSYRNERTSRWKHKSNQIKRRKIILAQYDMEYLKYAITNPNPNPNNNTFMQFQVIIIVLHTNRLAIVITTTLDNGRESECY